MAYFSKYFGKCLLLAHFHPKSSPRSPTNDLVRARPKRACGVLRRQSRGFHFTK